MKQSIIAMLDPDDIAWPRRLFNALHEGGTWGVPRSGLIFRKRSGDLVLTDRMPHMPGMPVDAVQLIEQQTNDYADIKRHFEAAGVPVKDETKN